MDRIFAEMEFWSLRGENGRRAATRTDIDCPVVLTSPNGDAHALLRFFGPVRAVDGAFFC